MLTQSNTKLIWHNDANTARCRTESWLTFETDHILRNWNSSGTGNDVTICLLTQRFVQHHQLHIRISRVLWQNNAPVQIGPNRVLFVCYHLSDPYLSAVMTNNERIRYTANTFAYHHHHHHSVPAEQFQKRNFQSSNVWLNWEKRK